MLVTEHDLSITSQIGGHSSCNNVDTKIHEPGRTLLGLSGRDNTGEQNVSNPVTLGIKSFTVIQVSLQHKIIGELCASKSH